MNYQIILKPFVVDRFNNICREFPAVGKSRWITQEKIPPYGSSQNSKTIIRAMHHIKCHAFRMNMLSIRRNKLN